MKNLRVVFLILWIATGVVGCATTGTIANLKKGETTKEDVRAIFGEPDRKEINTKGEAWHYKFIEEDKKQKGEMQTIHDLKIAFEKDLLEDYEILVSQLRRKQIEERPREERPKEQIQPPLFPPGFPPGRPPFPR